MENMLGFETIRFQRYAGVARTLLNHYILYMPDEDVWGGVDTRGIMKP